MKNIKITLALLFLSSLTACGSSGGGSDENKAMVGPFDTDNATAIGFSAVTGAEVKNSVCMPEIPTFDQFNQWAKNQAQQSPLVNQSFALTTGVNGDTSLSLFNQNQELTDALGALVFQAKAVTNMGGSMVPAPNKAVYNQIPATCTSIECVGQAAFGDTYGARLYFRQKFGFLISEYVDEEMLDGFVNAEDLTSVLYAVGTVPRSMIPVSRERYVKRFQDLSKNVILAPFKRGFVLPNTDPNTAAVTQTQFTQPPAYIDVSIYIYDHWQTAGDFYSKSYIIFHEFIHMFDIASAISESKEWIALSQWHSAGEGQPWNMGDPSKMCSQYGSSNPQEDLAECASMYRFAPLHLQSISMEKYDFIKNKVFQGVEFTHFGGCSDQVSLFPEIQ